MAEQAASNVEPLRRRVYDLLERGLVGNSLGTHVNRTLVALILVNLVAVSLELVPAYQARYAMWFALVEAISVVVFTAEYFLRLWTAVEHGPQRHMSPARARLAYALSAEGIVDLIAVAPFWFAPVLPDSLRVLLVFRFVRFLKIARYSPAMRSLLDVLYRERRALLGCLYVLLAMALLSATMMYLAERNVQPDVLGTIPDALWWAIVTLGTIGYGDVVPLTAVGKLIATMSIVFGIVIFALPVGIIATAFAEQIHRRDFIVTWGMIARVPLFAELGAADIADIMKLLRARVAETGQVVVRKGDTADSMYFVADGEVEVELPDKRIQLGVGQFFGEVAVLRGGRRSATVTALKHTSLLVLDAHDLHALMQRDARIAKSIEDVVAKRSSSGAPVLKNEDLVRGEAGR